MQNMHTTVVRTGEPDLVKYTADEQARVTLSPFVEIERHACVTPHTQIVVHREVDWSQPNPVPRTGGLNGD